LGRVRAHDHGRGTKAGSIAEKSSAYGCGAWSTWLFAALCSLAELGPRDIRLHGSDLHERYFGTDHYRRSSSARGESTNGNRINNSSYACQDNFWTKAHVYHLHCPQIYISLAQHQPERNPKKAAKKRSIDHRSSLRSNPLNTPRISDQKFKPKKAKPA
jgi:hypothetical protein